MMDQVPIAATAATPEVARLAKSGKIVVILQPRGTPVDAQNGASTQFALGPYMGVSLRAVVVGKTLVGIRADDGITAVNWLSTQENLELSGITVYGKGALGMSALHAAALDPRITRVVMENTLWRTPSSPIAMPWKLPCTAIFRSTPFQESSSTTT
jgi:hypothetical protein